ncbi:helix-turn-helix transcriptional regulator [uncultured Veillonella sp.]|uniref:helix-turn-helix domain-containing protein n=1 Tax=uncultured Veillonella sp. TaxID=159268 RepID=UPI002609E69A|nr:helix-turn-helix transcriptional regulator [uncultured Veillonella sp.]
MSDLGNREIFSKNLQYYMNLYNKTRIQVAKDIGVSYTTFTSWIKGTNYPRIDKIELLANYFRVNKADLIENKYSENEQYYSDPSVSEYAQAVKDNPDLRLLFDASKDMSKSDIDFVINTIEMLKKRENK